MPYLPHLLNLGSEAVSLRSFQVLALEFSPLVKACQCLPPRDGESVTCVLYTTTLFKEWSVDNRAKGSITRPLTICNMRTIIALETFINGIDMFNRYRNLQFDTYHKARQYFIDNYQQLISLEEYLSNLIYDVVKNNLDSFVKDFNECSYLFPFWQNYPPENRGRQPRGDQYPWLEVGEHVFSSKLPRLLAHLFDIRDVGSPTGADLRLVITNEAIEGITKGYTKSCWLLLDIKSVGPRDDQEHTVMSHNQVSGNGKWVNLNEGIKNKVMEAKGKLKTHNFHCSASPLYVFSDGSICPVIHIVIKPVYGMLTLENPQGDGGQPLRRITVISIPNGLLLEEQPNYLRDYPSLFFPGKDDKTKNPLKVRCRVSFPLLASIAGWRVRDIHANQ